MAQSADISQLLKSSPAERISLIAALWDSLVDEGSDVPLPEASVKEAERRLEDLKADPSTGVDLEEMQKRRGWNKGA